MPRYPRTLSAAAIAVLATAPALHAQRAAPRGAARAAAPSAAIEFLGFHAGDRLDAIAARVDDLGGGLRCDRSRADRRVLECRASFPDPQRGGQVTLWASAVDSVAGVITLAGPVEPDQLDEWRNTLQRRYGSADARAQGPQWMMQWVRRGRMVRLTWRTEKGERVASVSLVDGPVLDAWGRTRGGRAQHGEG